MNFINQKFFEISGLEVQNEKQIRSEESCRKDLEKWGVKFHANSKRPYFEGHERVDVVAYRCQFVDYFTTRYSNYYSLSESEVPEWILPNEKPCVLICHDETTFRSGEQSAKRWQIDGNELFFNKGNNEIFSIYMK